MINEAQTRKVVKAAEKGQKWPQPLFAKQFEPDTIKAPVDRCITLRSSARQTTEVKPTRVFLFLFIKLPNN